MSRLHEAADLADAIGHKVLQLSAERDELLRELSDMAREELERGKEYVELYECLIVCSDCERQRFERMERMLQVR